MGGYKYTFPESLDKAKVNEVAVLYNWVGSIAVDGQTIRSQRPMPPGLYDLLARYSKVESGPVHEDCENVYHQLLEKGTEAFPEIDNLFLQHGYPAHVVLAEIVGKPENRKELTRHIGENAYKKLIELCLRRNIQWRLFD
mgnify:CR=1 FL=1